MSFTGLALSTLAVGAAAGWAAGAGVTDTVRTLVVQGADVAAFGCLWVVQYVVLDRVLFGRRATGSRGSQIPAAPGDGRLRAA